MAVGCDMDDGWMAACGCGGASGADCDYYKCEEKRRYCYWNHDHDNDRPKKFLLFDSDDKDQLGGLWLDIIRANYLRGQPVAFAPRSGGSQFWQTIVLLMHVLRLGSSIEVGLGTSTLFWLDRVKFHIRNGKTTRFWKDMWLGEMPLATQYPALYNIVQRKETYDCYDFTVGFMEVQLSDQSDTIHWKLTTSGSFTVKSMYTNLINAGILPTSPHIWKIKIPLKIKIFMWFVHKGVILTKDNLVKRRWMGNSRCCFCNNNETNKHLFLECPLASDETPKSEVTTVTKSPLPSKSHRRSQLGLYSSGNRNLFLRLPSNERTTKKNTKKKVSSDRRITSPQYPSDDDDDDMVATATVAIATPSSKKVSLFNAPTIITLPSASWRKVSLR
ncbi:hypothetical protein ZWY2020_017177 [Hordeum vulgare]|nr:hypothetical protein ZWY2020_017177 [Hordeum vulgare]